MSHSVRKHLRLDVEQYDAAIRRFIPGYDTMLAVAARAVAAFRPPSVVDIGAGTGALSEAMLLHDEIGSVELLDIDREMLDQARARVATFGERVRFTLRSYDDPFEPGHAFASALSLHHIPSIEAKSSLFGRIYEALAPGGVLVNADANMPSDERERARLYRHWADHLVASGIPEQRAWKHFDEWSEEDTYLPVDAELDELRRLGFEAEQVWSDGPIGVVVATKPR